MNTPDHETPRDHLARQGAEAYAELTELAQAPQTPEHMRRPLRDIASLLADAVAATARADDAITSAEQQLDDTQNDGGT